MNPRVRLLIEVGPLLVFFVANARGGIFAATACLMAASVAAIVAGWAITKRIPWGPVATGVMVLIFGGITLALHDASFIKMKTSILYGLLGLVLLAALLCRLPLLERVVGKAWELSPTGWRVMTLWWSVFFLALAGLNEWVWRNFSTDTWVAFKTWGVIGFTVLALFCQRPLIRRYSLRRP